MRRKERIKREVGFEDTISEAEEFAHGGADDEHVVFGFGGEAGSEVADKRVEREQ